MTKENQGPNGQDERRTLQELLDEARKGLPEEEIREIEDVLVPRVLRRLRERGVPPEDPEEE